MYNGHADVTALLKTDGTIMAAYRYDAFGNALDDTAKANLKNIENPYTYAGYRFDDESGLYYLNARYYDPATARFMSEDTYRGDPNDPLSLNLYTYCHNEPVMYKDPSGLSPITVSWEGYIIDIDSSELDDYESSGWALYDGSAYADNMYNYSDYVNSVTVPSGSSSNIYNNGNIGTINVGAGSTSGINNSGNINVINTGANSTINISNTGNIGAFNPGANSVTNVLGSGTAVTKDTNSILTTGRYKVTMYSTSGMASIWSDKVADFESVGWYTSPQKVKIYAHDGRVATIANYAAPDFIKVGWSLTPPQEVTWYSKIDGHAVKMGEYYVENTGDTSWTRVKPEYVVVYDGINNPIEVNEYKARTMVNNGDYTYNPVFDTSVYSGGCSPSYYSSDINNEYYENMAAAFNNFYSGMSKVMEVAKNKDVMLKSFEASMTCNNMNITLYSQNVVDVFSSTCRSAAVADRLAELAVKNSEPFVPGDYWTKNANKLGIPNSKIDFQKFNTNTRQIEISKVIYDFAGRQLYRIDFSDHGRPDNHIDPHLHQYEYGPGFIDGRPKN